jgi:hypothetical protein
MHVKSKQNIIVDTEKSATKACWEASREPINTKITNATKVPERSFLETLTLFHAAFSSPNTNTPLLSDFIRFCVLFLREIGCCWCANIFIKSAF